MTSKTTTFSLLFLCATTAATLATASCGDDEPFLGTGGAGATGGDGGMGGMGGLGGMGGEGGGEGGCTADADCADGEVCEQATCVDSTCVDGELDGDESDVDCGGDCLPCDDGASCNDADDCASGFCNDGGENAGGGSVGGGNAGGGDEGGGNAGENAICAPCGTDADCAEKAGTYCSEGACVAQKALGDSCEAHTQCDSGFCPEDGVCCDDSCTGSCEACTEAATGEEDGTCAPVTMNTDPDGECTATDPATCGASGDGCNGDATNPGCILFDAQTSCGGASCVNGEASDESLCDGSGTCDAGATTSCGAYACDDAGVACQTSCNDDGDCASTHYCSGSTCVSKKSNGDGCTAGGECQSGFCPGEDGICCDAACDGTCEACLASKTGGINGVCGFVSSNTDPDNECGALTSCNGAGACTL